MKRFKDYDDAVSYILQIPRFSAKNDMDDTKAFLRIIGEAKAETVIHVAGTNGKGSTCAFLNSIYIEQKKITGMFTSPHLLDIRERIRINDEMISKDDFLACADYVMEKLDKMKDIRADYHPSFFEFVFFMAERYFSLKKAQVIIYETGLGGRLDATNSLSKKDVCVITQIGMDHMEYLGDTHALIAREKAGIIKKGVPVVCWKSDSECDQVIENRAKELGSDICFVGKDNISQVSFNKKNIDFSYKYGYDKDVMFRVQSYAHYQVYNAAIALKTLQVLQSDDCVYLDYVRSGIEKMTWRGRMEQIGPNVFVDGGHNEDGIAAFIDSVKADECTGKRYLIFSAVNDKRVSKISRMIVTCGLFDLISLCELKGNRASALNELEKIFKDVIDDTESCIGLRAYKSVREAYEEEKTKLKSNDRLYICGSLYLVSEILALSDKG
ncbi:MAG: bifunctional folylpolyglutamate synthase/dihydrofolate synthase [Lachnospiraceae bacterium]|nr:bifunctional folylpolyglutamate synthase/dihydrofolate synthase [Lachnospiraceae bacterium]